MCSVIPIGTIAEIHGPVVVVQVERLPPLRQALKVEHGDQDYLLEVHQHLDEGRLRAVAMHTTEGLRRGLTVLDTGGPLAVPVGGECLGRVVNLFGQPLDGGPPL
ncbi:MAG: F0F1 ATP synthase subunit beta, partial [Candidatus Eremiobacteraeota bacterium]|nr:F0F1 ATP synthase subunit beta [Candidatus Eremiobacteraeota bacterium]